MRELITRLLALLPAFLVASGTLAATGLRPGGLNEFQVELPLELRRLAGRGQMSQITHALVTVAVPANFDATCDCPVMVVSATSDPEHHSSRALLRAYADTASTAGWLLIAADPSQEVAAERDEVTLRYALTAAALAALDLQWPGSAHAPVAFGGFSGGAKYSGWLAAAFASQGRTVIGIYLAGINEDTIVEAARHFNTLNDTFRRIPVFLQSGEKDEIATPADHQDVQKALKRAGLRNVRIEYFPGTHAVDPAPLHTALLWFRELASQQGVSLAK